MAQPKKAPKKKSSLNKARMRATMERSLDSTRNERRSKERLAQDLVYDAMEAETSEQRLDLAWQALALDPEHADALLMVLDSTRFEGEDRIDALRRIVSVAERRLGKNAVEEHAPHFWGVLDTRPYMRARMHLAEELRAAGRLEEAIEHYKEMLVLNENDNQGVRYYLLPCLLALKRLDDARALMKCYPGECDWNAAFAWGRVLERLLSGDNRGAAKALDAARKQNPHLEVYLNSQKRLPKNLPHSYSPGSKDEALCYAELVRKAWQRHREAEVWLAKQRETNPMERMDRKD